jgi:hypothetical protein
MVRGTSAAVDNYHTDSPDFDDFNKILKYLIIVNCFFLDDQKSHGSAAAHFPHADGDMPQNAPIESIFCLTRPLTLDVVRDL